MKDLDFNNISDRIIRVNLQIIRDAILALEAGVFPSFELEWHEVTNFEDNWVNFGAGYAPAAYAKDPLGFVHIRGEVKDGLYGGPPYHTVFTLPVEYRPPYNHSQTVECNNAFGVVDILAEGRVVPTVLASNISLSLDPIIFYVG